MHLFGVCFRILRVFSFSFDLFGVFCAAAAAAATAAVRIVGRVCFFVAHTCLPACLCDRPTTTIAHTDDCELVWFATWNNNVCECVQVD